MGNVLPYNLLVDQLKSFWRVYISTVNRVLFALFSVSIFVLVAHDVLFAGWPELFVGGAALWNLFYQLCLAFAASFIFYFVVVHRKEQREKETLRPFLHRYTGYLVEDAKEIAQKLKEASSYNPAGGFPPTLDDVFHMCQAVSPFHRTPGLSWVKWHEFLAHRSNRTKENITRIYAATPFLDPEHLQRIMDLDNSVYFKRLEVFIQNRAEHESLSIISDQLHEYLVLAKCLEEYAYTNLSLRGSETPKS